MNAPNFKLRVLGFDRSWWTAPFDFCTQTKLEVVALLAVSPASYV